MVNPPLVVFNSPLSEVLQGLDPEYLSMLVAKPLALKQVIRNCPKLLRRDIKCHISMKSIL